MREELEARCLSPKGLKSQLAARLTKVIKTEEEEEAKQKTTTTEEGSGVAKKDVKEIKEKKEEIKEKEVKEEEKKKKEVHYLNVDNFIHNWGYKRKCPLLSTPINQLLANSSIPC